jgi:DNA-binding MarR family transcriptional regulator
MPLTKSQYEALSEFRYQLRRFLNFSEAAAKAEGLSPLQYLLLLHVRGFPGRDWATVGELAEKMQMKPHGTVALISRSEELGLVERRQCTRDRRVVEVHLTPRGSDSLEKLASMHEVELRSLQKTFRVSRITSFNNLEAHPAQEDASARQQ